MSLFLFIWSPLSRLGLHTATQTSSKGPRERGREAGSWRTLPECPVGTHAYCLVDVGILVISSLFTNLSSVNTVILLNFVCILLDANLLRVGSVACD